MTSRQRAAGAGAADARRIIAELGRDVVAARRSAGISQRALGARAGISPSHVGRFERGEIRHPSLELACRCARAVGLVVACRAYPDGTQVRDAASLALLKRFEALLGQPLVLRREVGLPIAGDKRAWDARVSGGASGAASVEAESHLDDVQATTRRVDLKARDDPGAGVIILLVNKTAHNRAVLALHREALRAQFPLDGATILRHLRAGRIPPASGIVVL
jgi:transcriptional regulator with XRE-family HTH domain